MKTTLSIIVCLMLTVASSTIAQTKPGSTKQRFAQSVEAQSAPTPEHKALEPFVGDFDQQTKVRLGPGEPIRAHSIGHAQWVMDGRFVRVDSQSAPDEEL